MTGLNKGKIMKTYTSDPEITENLASRDSLLRSNSKLIAQLQKRVSAKRFRVQEGDTIKLGYVRALIQSLQVQNAIIKDVELDALKKELEEVRELVKKQSCK